MGLFDFVKNAGASLFGMKTDEQKREDKQAAIQDKLSEYQLDIQDLVVTFSGDDDEVIILEGTAQSQADKEKLILTVGNVEGVAQVDDRIVVEVPEPPAVFHTVKSGDSLSKIAKTYYGNAMRYNEIFEANKPMLKDPNLIYPGQVLRIPGAEA